MKTITALAAGALLLSLGGPAWAQNVGVEEIVVTAQRLSDYDPGETPYVALRKRADNLIVTVQVICDTRDPQQRKSELTASLRALVKLAEQQGIALGIEDEDEEDVMTALDPAKLEKMIGGGGKPDTSSVSFTLKTKIQPTDTFGTATGRVEAFVGKTPKVGRTEVLLQDDWNLTLFGPEQYREQIIALVAADARKTASAFGPDYGASVEGLTLPVTWYQSAPLELALYIPYRQRVER
jgi:hypothetical protein